MPPFLRPPLALTVMVGVACAKPAKELEEPCPPGSSRRADGLCYLDSVNEDTGSPSDSGGGSSESGESWGAGPAEWDTEAALRAFELALVGAVVEPWELLRAWEAPFVHADAECPGGDGAQIPLDIDGCTAVSGWEFAGIATLERPEIPGMVAFSLFTDAEIRAPDGQNLTAGGTTSLGWPMVEGPISLKASGDWAGSLGGEAVGEHLSMSLELRGMRGAAGLGEVSLEGSVGRPAFSVFFWGISRDVDCTLGTGALSVRDPSGGWHRLDLPDCSGCGELRYEDGEPAAACLDVGTYLVAQTQALEAEP
jgi:hypothetical protein